MLRHATAALPQHDVGVLQLLPIRHNSKGNGNDSVLLNSCETSGTLVCDYKLVNDRRKHMKSDLQAMPYELVQAAALKLLKLAL